MHVFKHGFLFRINYVAVLQAENVPILIDLPAATSPPLPLKGS